MTQYIDINNYNSSNLGDLKACLDYPICGYNNNDNILIAGWVLPPEPLNNDIKVIIRLEENEEYQYVNTTPTSRPDVLKAMLPNISLPAAAMLVGFSVRVPFKKSGKATVIIVRDGKELPWYNINVIVEDALTLFVKQLSSSTKENIESIDINDIISNIKVYHPHTFEYSHSSRIHSHLKKIIKSVKIDEFIVELYKSQNGKINCNISSLNFDICVSKPTGHHVFLFCRDESGILFIIHQHVTSIDGVYYPSEGIYYSFCHSSQNMLSVIVKLLLKDFDYFNSNHYKETAYLIGHGRPYHFMYDGMLGLETINQNIQQLDSNTKFYTLDNNAFIDAPKVYNRNQKANFVDNKTLNRLEQEGTLFIKIGALFANGADNNSISEKIHSLDKKIISYVNDINENNTLTDLKKHFPIIWLGVTGQKRAWLEQIEGYSNLINKLYESYPGMAVIFDGWTSSLVSLSRDITETEIDHSIINEIKKSIPSDLTIVDLVGATIDKKIHVGSIIDCAVVNYSTGSINVSRICGRPCVTHMNNSFKPARNQHIHKNAYHIPDEHVDDVADPNSGIDSTSYHIDWKNIYNALVLHLGKQNLIEQRW